MATISRARCNRRAANYATADDAAVGVRAADLRLRELNASAFAAAAATDSIACVWRPLMSSTDSCLTF